MAIDTGAQHAGICCRHLLLQAFAAGICLPSHYHTTEFVGMYDEDEVGDTLHKVEVTHKIEVTDKIRWQQQDRSA